MAGKSSLREPKWYGIPFRVAFVTFLLTLLSFAVSLLLGIVGLVLLAKVRGRAPNLAMAYRNVAFPLALGVGAIVLVFMLGVEVRHYRQSKALARLEKIVDGS